MEWIRNWAMQLAGITVLAAVCEMIMPRGGMEKYVRPTLGFILVIVLVRPFTAAVPKTIGLGTELGTVQTEAAELKNSLSEHERDELLKLYRKKLSENIAAELAENGMCVSAVNVEIEEKSDSDFGSITSVTVMTGEEGDKSEAAIKDILKKSFNVLPDAVQVQ